MHFRKKNKYQHHTLWWWLNQHPSELHFFLYGYLVFTTVELYVSECSIIHYWVDIGLHPGSQGTDSSSWRTGRAPAAPLRVTKDNFLFNDFSESSIHCWPLAHGRHSIHCCVITITLVWLIVELHKTIKYKWVFEITQIVEYSIKEHLYTSCKKPCIYFEDWAAKRMK